MRIEKIRDMVAAAGPGLISAVLFAYLAASVVFGVGENLTF